jgi:glyoxylase-like metal-dependent hydrolase (beta-lactamase superfamily II)/phenylpyruvate tautomerase PptA (4-oxalocrotonate tautomerase family)
MPLWNVYCGEGTYSPEDKRAFAESITDIYSSSGMPRFYVSVVFHEVPRGSLFIGGTPRENFVRIAIDHIARTTPAEHRESLLQFLNESIHPFVGGRGLDWEIHIDETPRDLWTIQGMRPPDPGSAEEQRWARENRPSRILLQYEGLTGGDVTVPAPAGAAVLRAEVFISPFLHFDFQRAKGTFSPTTSTLIFGKTQAILIDAQHIRSEVAALGDLIERTGRRLTTIYVTHGHADHWYGAGELLARFPGARAVATRGVVDYITESAELGAPQWSQMFGERLVDPTAIPEVLERKQGELEGAEVRVVDVGQGDIAPSTVVHVPAIDTVVAGDVVYNQIHAMLAFGGPKEWERWIHSVDTVEKLAPRMVVAGHKRPDSSDWEVSRMLDETRSYISDFAGAARTAGSADELISMMTSKYPDFGNQWTLQFSAQSWFAGQSA